MSIVFIFIGWFILCILWGFLPLVEALRLWAISSTQRRKLLSLSSGLLAFLSGLLLLLWLGSYSAMLVFVYYAHGDSALLQGMTETQVNASVIPAANQMFVQQFVPTVGCVVADPAACNMVKQARELGSLTSMLVYIDLIALLPGLVAAVVCWKLTSAQQPKPA